MAQSGDTIGKRAQAIRARTEMERSRGDQLAVVAKGEGRNQRGPLFWQKALDSPEGRPIVMWDGPGTGCFT